MDPGEGNRGGLHPASEITVKDRHQEDHPEKESDLPVVGQHMVSHRKSKKVFV